MKRAIALLLLAAGTAFGQIENPPSSVNIVDATATGRAVLTATNAAAAANAIGLGVSNQAVFNTTYLSDSLIISGTNPSAIAGPTASSRLDGAVGLQFLGSNAATLAATTRTNLGLGATNAVTFSNITASGTLGVSNAATFATNVTINGTLSVGSLTTTTPSTWALDATQTAAATNGILALPSNANVIRLTNNNAISGVSGGVLGAFYFLINQSGTNVVISNSATITTRGATNITLGANESATLISTTATNATAH